MKTIQTILKTLLLILSFTAFISCEKEVNKQPGFPKAEYADIACKYVFASETDGGCVDMLRLISLELTEDGNAVLTYNNGHTDILCYETVAEDKQELFYEYNPTERFDLEIRNGCAYYADSPPYEIESVLKNATCGCGRFARTWTPYRVHVYTGKDKKEVHHVFDVFDSEDIALKISEGYGVQLPTGDEPFVIHDLILTKAGTFALVLDGRFHGTQYEGYDSGFPGSWSVKDGKVSYAFEEDMPFVGRAGEGTIEFKYNWKDEPYCRFILNGKDADIEFYMIPKTFKQI